MVASVVRKSQAALIICLDSSYDSAFAHFELIYSKFLFIMTILFVSRKRDFGFVHGFCIA